MNILKSLVLLFSISMIAPAHADIDIYPSSSVEEINNNLLKLLEKRNAQKTLVILPLEGFILKAVAPELNVGDEKFQAIRTKLDRKIKLSKRDYIDELILTEYEHQLSDPKIVDFFKNIQEQKAPFVVVTRNFSGSFNKIPYLEAWIWASLFEKGIDLSNNPIGSNQIIFNQNNKKIKGTYPTFYRGLLSCNFSDGENSPQGLIARLLAVNLKWFPDVVYVIDKDEEYIKSIAQQFKMLNKDAQIIGFIYAPDNDQSDKVSSKDFLKFWEELVVKLNAVSRKELKREEDPYEK